MTLTYLASSCFKYILVSIQQLGQTKVRNLNDICIQNWNHKSITVNEDATGKCAWDSKEKILMHKIHNSIQNNMVCNKNDATLSLYAANIRRTVYRGHFLQPNHGGQFHVPQGTPCPIHNINSKNIGATTANYCTPVLCNTTALNYKKLCCQ